MKQSVFNLLKIAGLLGLLRFLKKDKITLLCFHRISDENSPSWPPLKIKVFEKLLQYIIRNYNVISLQDIDNKEVFENKKPKIILTFDDGYKDFYHNVLPLLKKYDLPAVLNIVTDCADGKNLIWTQKLNKIIEAYYFSEVPIKIDINEIRFNSLLDNGNISKIGTGIYLALLNTEEKKRNEFINELEKNITEKVEHTGMMNWQEIKECLQNNITIGSHTKSHVNLTKINDKEKLNDEIIGSKTIIEQRINYQTGCIAFPNGQYNNIVKDMAVKSGYKYLLAVDEKLFEVKRNTGHHLIPRIMIQHETYTENCFKIENFHNIIKKILK
ncbi:MAG: polysaccharide deacetylase family protein [Bacteroidales bacterium]|nr:polysaccharide deacetylase family protein [Bacteroidales bacterium]